MFTGLIQEVGSILNISQTSKGTTIEIASPHALQNAKVGDSIAVNGCCLTISELTPISWSADVVTETLQVTCLGELQIGDPVNIESALRFSDRLGGHLVQGHIDGIGKILKKENNPDHSITVSIEAPPHILRYIVKKGSIAVDGVSLTVAYIDDHSFSFAMIPHTAKMTNLGWKQVGSHVNLETDLIAKYVEKLVRI